MIPLEYVDTIYWGEGLRDALAFPFFGETMEDIKIMMASFYNQVDPRRAQEHADARMIAEDHRAMSNLSEKEINREFNAWRRVERLAMYDQSDK